MKNKVERKKRKKGDWLRQFVFISPLFFFFVSCGSDICRTPFGEGGELSQPDFVSLYNNPGETLVINRGYRGIIVHCTNLSEYVAFDCVCPYCRNIGMQPDDSHRASLLECQQCGSRFDLFFGNPLEGAQTACMLYQYNTHYDGRYLSIY